jgi:hypothetical protein
VSLYCYRSVVTSPVVYGGGFERFTYRGHGELRLVSFRISSSHRILFFSSSFSRGYRGTYIIMLV